MLLDCAVQINSHEAKDFICLDGNWKIFLGCCSSVKWCFVIIIIIRFLWARFRIRLTLAMGEMPVRVQRLYLRMNLTGLTGFYRTKKPHHQTGWVSGSLERASWLMRWSKGSQLQVRTLPFFCATLCHTLSPSLFCFFSIYAVPSSVHQNIRNCYHHQIISSVQHQSGGGVTSSSSSDLMNTVNHRNWSQVQHRTSREGTSVI